MSEKKHSDERERKRRLPPPLPPDAPLLSFEDAARYLRMTPAAFRTIIHGRTDGYDDELGSRLRAWVVILSSHRRFIRRQPFMKWLRGLAGEDAA